MRLRCLLAVLVILQVPAAIFPQTQLYLERFEGGFPAGWSSTPTGVYQGTGSSFDRFSITNSTPSPDGGNNLLFKNCDPEGDSPGDYHEVETAFYSTTGYANIRLRYYHRKTGTFNPDVTVQWSVDGVNWNTITGIPAVPTLGWQLTGWLVLPAGADNQANLKFRYFYTAINTPNSNSNYPNCDNFGIGNYRIDAFEIAYITILPISLIDFSATPQNQTITLNWSTATETNNAHFLLERSANGAVFTELATIPGAGNSAERRDYGYVDRAPLPGTSYYRLRQVDFDGRYTFSPVRTVAFGGLGAVQVSPVPTDGRVQVSLAQASGEALTWELFDQSGRRVRLGAEDAETAQFELDVTDLPAGWYALRLTDGRESYTVRVMRR